MTNMPIAKVHRISAAAPDDVSGIEAAIAAGRIDPKGVIAILGKTEGNGLVNDFARGYASLALSLLFQRYLPKAGGRQDLPRDVGRHRRRHGAALDGVRARRRQRRAGPVAGDRPRRTRRRCRRNISAAWRRSTRSQPACARRWRMPASTMPADVHFVQVKCPLLTVARIAEADARGASRGDARHARSRWDCRAPRARSASPWRSARSRRRASAMPISAANWELCVGTRELFGRRRTARTRDRGVRHVAAWSGPLAIDHAVMADAIDIEPVRAALARLGLRRAGQLREADRESPGRGARQGRGEP